MKRPWPLGLSYWRMMLLVVMPQALKVVIPGIVNNFISLFKDTSLVSVIGIFDLFNIVQSGFNDAKWASRPNRQHRLFCAGADLLGLLLCHVALFPYSLSAGSTPATRGKHVRIDTSAVDDESRQQMVRPVPCAA